MFNRPDSGLPGARQEPAFSSLPALGTGFPAGQQAGQPIEQRQGGMPSPLWLWPFLLFRKAWFGALLLILIVVPMEMAARHVGGNPWWRPATWFGDFQGEINNAYTKGHTEGQAIMADQLKRVESNYNQRAAEAQAFYQAQLSDFTTRIQQKAQEEVAVVQAKLTQMTEAAKALYLRGNQMALTAAEVAKSYEQARIALAERSAGGQVLTKNVADVLKGFAAFLGSPNLYARSDALARSTQAEIAADMKGATADLIGPRVFQNWAQGIALPEDLATELARTAPPRFETSPKLPPQPVPAPIGRAAP